MQVYYQAIETMVCCEEIEISSIHTYIVNYQDLVVVASALTALVFLYLSQDSGHDRERQTKGLFCGNCVRPRGLFMGHKVSHLTV